MAEKWAEARARLLSTEYPHWKNLISCLALFVSTTAMVLSWWYAYFAAPDAGCHHFFLFFSLLWLVAQWVVIGYLYGYRNIPYFARGAITFLMLVANMWFGFFIFSLQSCGS